MAKSIIKICEYCRKQYTSTQYGRRRLDQKYCGMSCRNNGIIQTTNARYEAMFEKTPGCWKWKGSLNHQGYGRATFQNKRQLAHRIAFFLAFPHQHEDLSKLCVLHKCDTPSCVNPSHLFLGTRTENNLDKRLKNRNPKGETSHFSKLTEDQVQEIRSIAANTNMTHKEIAELFGITRENISCIVRRVSWIHI